MNRWRIASIVGLVALLGFLWFVRSESGRSRAGTPAPAAASESPSTTPDVARTELAPADSSPSSEPALAAPEAPAETREAVTEISAAELARAEWVEGRVQFPAGTPPDDEVFVETRGLKSFEGNRQHRAVVGPDGAFRVAFPAGSKTGWIALSARYLELAQPVRWKRSDSRPIVLVPELGGCVDWRVVLPDGDTEPPSGRVSCTAWTRGNMIRFGDAPGVELGRGLAHSFTGLPKGRVSLRYEGESFLPRDVETEVEPGRTTTVEIALRRGATLAGRVVDARGAPLAGAKVFVSATFDHRSLEHSTLSVADGSFRLRAVPLDAEQVSASLPGHMNAVVPLAGLEEGARLEDLTLVLGGGTAIAGRATLADGQPIRAHVRLRPEDHAAQRRLGLDPIETEADANGRFRIDGLEAGTYTIEGSDWKESGFHLTSAIEHRAVLHGVAAGTEGLELVLREGLEVRGRVLDERGKPVDASVSVSRDTATYNGSMGTTTGLDGTFLVRGLEPGRWRVSARRDGQAATQMEVEIPGAEPLELVLRRRASVAGRVLDEHDAPLQRATVHANDGWASTDEHGAFELAGLGPGRHTLSVSARDFVSSEELELELGENEARRDVVLRLKKSGSITGEVLDREGKPLAGAWIYLGDGTGNSSQSDEDGRFKLEDLPPGEVQVTAVESGRGLRLSDRAIVVGGETTHVRLQMPESGVRMHGVVHDDLLADVSIHTRLSETEQDGPWCNCAADGSYALEFTGPGAYWVGVSCRGGDTHDWLLVDVPAVAEFAHDIDLRVGRVAGQVRSPDGSPLAHVFIVAEQSSDTTGALGWGRALTDEHGEYELVLPAAVYGLVAGGDGGDSDPVRSFARARVADVVVTSGAFVRGSDFELSEGGTLEGNVRRADGSPVAAAEVWIGPQGVAVQSDWLARTDERGHFRAEGVARGKFVVTATQEKAVAEWIQVEVAAGSTRSLELVLH